MDTRYENKAESDNRSFHGVDDETPSTRPSRMEETSLDRLNSCAKKFRPITEHLRKVNPRRAARKNSAAGRPMTNSPARETQGTTPNAFGGLNELYNLNDDPRETRNPLSGPQYACVISRLAGEIHRWQETAGDRLRL
jgi:hypothetical protein